MVKRDFYFYREDDSYRDPTLLMSFVSIERPLAAVLCVQECVHVLRRVICFYAPCLCVCENVRYSESVCMCVAERGSTASSRFHQEFMMRLIRGKQGVLRDKR